MATLTFEPFEFIDHLKESGMPEQQAKAIAKALQRVNLSHVATKTDIVQLEARILKWLIILLFGQASIIVAVLKFL